MSILKNALEPEVVVYWDWKQQPNWREIAQAIDYATASLDLKVYFTEVDTRSDDHAVIISVVPLSAEEADKIGKECWENPLWQLV